MGAGKSKVAVDYCNGINAKKVLIICPKKVISVWPSQFNKHSHARFRLLAKENGSIASQSEEIKKFISTYENYGGVAVVLNYERFWRAPLGPSYNERNRMVDIGLLSKIQWDLLIADEAHRIKAPNGQAAWGMARLAQRVPRRLFLSGTPMPHSPLDIYSQFRALAPEVFGRKYTAFKMNYCIMGGFENRQVVAFKNLEDLHNKFYSIAHRVTIEEAVDLPEFNDVNIDVDLSPKAKKIYSQLEREFIAECENGEITADNSLTKLLRLAQIAGGNLKLDSGREEIIDSGKIDTAAEIIQDLPPDEPVVVFARFRSEIERMKQAVTGLGRKPGEITGSQNDLKKWGAGEIDTVVVQIQACGEGIDLTRSRYCIYLSKGYSLGQVMQSRARVHRPGQSRKVTYYHINAKGTVDVLIERAIKTKQKITNDVLDIKDIVLNELKEECHVGHRETDEIREAV
jgi:SNF2 family DNA or RNA helicase